MNRKISQLTRLVPAAASFGFVLGLAALSACSGSSGTSDSTTRALADPMNYQPQMDDRSISGGGISDFNRKDFQKDVDDVLNP